MNKLLRRPHWQVFLYLTAGTLIPNTDIGSYIKVVYGAIFLVWVLKINEELFHRATKTSLKINRFQTALIISFLYLAIIFLFTDGYEINTEKDNFTEYGWLLFVYVPLHIFTFGSYLYALYFTSRLIYQLETELLDQQKDHSVLIFTALLFLPIGIWWIQPKINRLLALPPISSE